MKLTHENLRSLALRRGGPHVSLYLPVHTKGAATRQNRIRLKNLVSEAGHRLRDFGLSAPEADRLLEPGRRLLEDAPFWGDRSAGLALFLAEGFFRLCDLPYDSAELVVVTRRFHLKPILPLFQGDRRFLLLAVSQNRTRLFRCDRFDIEEIRAAGMPRSQAEALAHDDPQRQVQFHTGMGAARGGRRAVVVHGQGVGHDDSDDRLLRYCQSIDRAVEPVLTEERAPLVLACARPLDSVYRQINRSPALVEDGLLGNPDETSEKELHARALELLTPHFAAERERAIQAYQERIERKDSRGTGDLRRIVPASMRGRVDCLFVPLGTQRWGAFDPDQDRMVLHESQSTGDEDLLDLAAMLTVVHGGTVYALPPKEMPYGSAVAALLRY